MKRILFVIILALVFGAEPAHAEEPIHVHLFGADWAVAIPGEGFQVNPQATNIGEETARIVGTASATGMSFSGDIIPDETGGGSVMARMVYIQRNIKRFGMSDLDEYENGEFAVVEFMRKKSHGKKVNEKNVLVCLAHRGSWAYIKLWKKDFTEEDRQHFDRILEGIRLVDRKESDYTPDELVARGQASGQTRQIFLPGATWAVELPDEGFETDEDNSGRTRDRLKFTAHSDPLKMMLTAFIEPAEGEGGSTAARAFFHGAGKKGITENIPMIFSDEKSYERGPLAIQEYTFREYKGVELNQQHLHIYLAHQDNWVDIHLSKVNYTETDRAAFDRIIDGVRVVERQESDLTSAEFIELGSLAVKKGRCEEADANFKVALSINKVKTQMKQEDFVGTLAALGFCYGKAGEYEKALTTLQSAIKLEPGKAILHYNVACAHAELRDEGAAVTALNTAYEKLLDHPYDLIPDPREDPSFDSMKKNADFKKIAKKISKRINKSEKELAGVSGRMERRLKSLQHQ